MSKCSQIEWLWLSCKDIEIELKQLQDEGRDVSSLEKEFADLIAVGDERIVTQQSNARDLLIAAQKLGMRGDYKFSEPSELSEILPLRSLGPRKYSIVLDDAEIADHIRGAWLGRCIGCLLGKPVEAVEMKMFHDYLKASGQWPLHDYVRFDVESGLASQYPFVRSRTHYDHLDYMPVDDDTNYTLLGYLILEKHGPDFSSYDVAKYWLESLPILATCTAERVAYRNATLQIYPPQTATHLNPYREWIGAQIRADAFGYVALGDPQKAAEFAFKDAAFTHVKNGIYGEMFAAALIAAAPFCRNIPELLRVGISEIPQTSRLYAAIECVFGWFENGFSYGQVVTKIHNLWNEKDPHDWVHTIPNAVICAAALLWGNDDFSKSVCYAVEPCFDADCNGATVGSIMGMRHGTRGIAPTWTRHIAKGLKTSLPGLDYVDIYQIADRTFKLYESVNRG